MSDTNNANPAADNTDDNAMRNMPEGGNMPIVIHAQYIKDLSFENPDSPQSLKGLKDEPKMNINIGMDARKLPAELAGAENYYEVVLNVRAEAKTPEALLFIAELQYGMTVSLNDVPEDQHHPVLLIEIPRMAFPYARQILSDLTTQGGYPPLLLNPVDFHALYLDRFKEEIAAQQAAAQSGAGQASVN
ncbi:MAG: protein-export chaperone SecB [Alphaproteobacteria bacterium]